MKASLLRETSFKGMSVDLKKSGANGSDIPTALEEQQEKIKEVRKLLGELPDKLFIFCSDASISRYLRARNWNVKKATKMLKETLKWRFEYKPEEIRWDEVAHEAETGKIYRSNYIDKFGRTVLVMRPGCQVVKPFLEPKTYSKVKFVYSDDHGTKKIMEDLFDMEQLESAFGGLNQSGFNINDYAERMKEDDKRMPLFWSRENPAAFSGPSSVTIPCFNPGNSECDSDDSDKEHLENSSPCRLASGHSSEVNLLEISGGGNSTMEIQSGSDEAT